MDQLKHQSKQPLATPTVSYAPIAQSHWPGIRGASTPVLRIKQKRYGLYATCPYQCVQERLRPFLQNSPWTSEPFKKQASDLEIPITNFRLFLSLDG